MGQPHPEGGVQFPCCSLPLNHVVEMDNIETSARRMREDRRWLPYEEQLRKLRLFSLERDKRVRVYINA